MWMEEILLGFSQGPGHGISGCPSGQSIMHHSPGSLVKQFLYAAVLSMKTACRARNRVVWIFLTGTVALTETRTPAPPWRTVAQAEDSGWSRVEAWGGRNCTGNNQWGVCHQRAVFPLCSIMFLTLLNCSGMGASKGHPPLDIPPSLCMLFVTILLPGVLWGTENFIIKWSSSSNTKTLANVKSFLSITGKITHLPRSPSQSASCSTYQNCV